LVNNMPDAAFVDTEHQFRSAIAADPGGGVTELRLYTLAELPRSEEVAAVIAANYSGLDALLAEPPDALIVTGTEPTQAQLPYEPYWPFLARLLEWAPGSVPVTMLSCLAAHASVLLFDGIQRVAGATKCSGVFAGAADPVDPLSAGLPQQVPVPHSRVNGVPEEAMTAAGYRIVIGSGPRRAGWAVAARNYGDALFVLCQGHPEYSTLSLLREYRRDVRRSLFGRGAVPYPRLPEGYLGPEATRILEDFAQRASRPGADAPALWEAFPFELAAGDVQNTWAEPMASFYGNWLGIARGALGARSTA